MDAGLQTELFLLYVNLDPFRQVNLFTIILYPLKYPEITPALSQNNPRTHIENFNGVIRSFALNSTNTGAYAQLMRDMQILEGLQDALPGGTPI